MAKEVEGGQLQGMDGQTFAGHGWNTQYVDLVRKAGVVIQYS